MKKRILMFLNLGIIWFNLTFAHDCHLFLESSIQELSNPLSNKQHSILNVITLEGLERSLINLKSYCCSSMNHLSTAKFQESCQKDELLRKNTTHYPESPYLFDQLFDTMIRRLTIEENYNDVPADEQATTWEKAINMLAENPNGVFPPALSKDYQHYRWLQSKYLLPLYNGVSLQEYQQTMGKREQETILKNYKQRNLNTKYYNLCQNAIYLMTLLPSEFRSAELSIAQIQCSQNIKQILDAHAKYLNTLIIHKSNLLLTQSLKNYTQNYLISNRFQSFENTLNSILNSLLGVVRIIPKLERICN